MLRHRTVRAAKTRMSASGWADGGASSPALERAAVAPIGTKTSSRKVITSFLKVGAGRRSSRGCRSYSPARCRRQFVARIRRHFATSLRKAAVQDLGLRPVRDALGDRNDLELLAGCADFISNGFADQEPCDRGHERNGTGLGVRFILSHDSICLHAPITAPEGHGAAKGNGVA